MVEFLLKYPQIVFDQGDLIFASDWSRWGAITLFLIALGLILSTITYKRHVLDAWKLFAIGLLQVLMVLVVIIILWQPSIMTKKLRAGDNVVAIVLDASESMNYSEGGVSRMQQALSMLEHEVFQILGSEYTVQPFIFSDQATSVKSFEVLPAPQKATMLTDSISQILGMSRSTPLGAVILISDGADNSGSITQAQLAEIRAHNVPIHTLAVGSERIEEDLELQDVLLPSQAMPGTILSARVTIRHDKAGLARLKIYDDDKILMAHEIELQGDVKVTTSWIDIPIGDTGYRHFKFSLDRWPNEQIIENNIQSRVVEVKEEKYQILYIEGEPRWEYKFIRRALEQDPSISLVSLLQVSQNKYYRQGIHSPTELENGFPNTKEELFKYQALIIGSIEAASFTPEQQQMIHDFVSERGGGLLMLAGRNGLGAGGWGNSPVSEALPARLGDEDSTFVRERTKVGLTLTGLHSPMLKLGQDISQNQQLWNEIPEIADYQGIGSLKPAASVFLKIDTGGLEVPLLVSQRFGRGFSYILATGGTWRWQMSLPLSDQRHETFWRQLVRELVINSPGRFSVSSQVVADRIKINTELRDVNYELEQGLDLTAIITSDSGDSMTMELHHSVEQPGMMTGEFRTDQSGIYNIEAITRRNNELIDSARFAIYHNAGIVEYFSLRTNNTLLRQLAEATGGQVWTKQNLSKMIDAVQISKAGITEQEIKPLWDAPIIFLVLIFLKSLEWMLRRQWRII